MLSIRNLFGGNLRARHFVSKYALKMAAVIFGVLFFILLLNQIDAPLKGVIKELEQKPLTVSETEKLFYESFVAQSYCAREGLTQDQKVEILEAFTDAAPFYSTTFEDFQLRMNCSLKLFEEGDATLFSDLTSAHKKNQAQTERLLRKTIQLALKSQDNATVLESSRALLLLHYSLVEAQKIQKRNRNYRLPYKNEIAALLQVTLQERLEAIRDAELRILLDAINDPVEGSENPFAPLTHGVWRVFFFQKNRTLNTILEYWNRGIDHAVQCQTVAECRNFPMPRFRWYHTIFNPAGQTFYTLVAPNIPGVAERTKGRLRRIQELFEEFK